MKISVFGLGKLGASMAAVLAFKGHDVIGVDVVKASVEALNEGRAPVWETNLDRYIKENRERLTATMDHAEAIQASDLSFVIVPTPSDNDGAFSLEYALSVFSEIGRALRAKGSYHVVVMTSTVLPGSTRSILIDALESESGKTCGVDFGVCYSPAFIALGSIIHDFLNPDFLLIGESDKKAGATLEVFYDKTVDNAAKSIRMSIENAELTKISLNAFITTKITFANMIADLCERIPGGDVDVVSDALGMDKRIGRQYLTGGMGYGGPCFPRDNVALSFLANAVGTSAPLAEATDDYNRTLADKIVSEFGPDMAPGAKVAVLGLAYKPASNWTEESQGIFLANAWNNGGHAVCAFDPLANEMARTMLPESVKIVNDVITCLKNADVVLITTPDKVWKNIPVEEFCGKMVVDFWRLLSDKLDGRSDVQYVPYGRNRSPKETMEKLRFLWRDRL